MTMFGMDDARHQLLLFVYLQNVNDAVKRVKQRVKNGGHNIPPDIIERRFVRGLKNLIKIYLPLADRWVIMDNSHENPIFAAEGKSDEILIHDVDIWSKIKGHE